MNRLPTSIVVAVMVIFCAMLAAVIAVVLAVEDGARATTMVSLILPSGASAIGVMVVLARLAMLDTKVDKVNKRTEDLTNGLLDSKIRAGVADVAHPDMLDPEASDQIEHDRARRAAAAEEIA